MLLNNNNSADRIYEKAFLGGTFDRFHDGHDQLISTAVLIADFVYIGIVSDDLGLKLFNKKKHNDMIKPFDIRKNNVLSFISYISGNLEVGELIDSWGPAPNDSTKRGVLVVSYETRNSGTIINNKRLENNLLPLDIFVIPWVRDDSNNTISSSRIRENEFRNGLSGN